MQKFLKYEPTGSFKSRPPERYSATCWPTTCMPTINVINVVQRSVEFITNSTILNKKQQLQKYLQVLRV